MWVVIDGLAGSGKTWFQTKLIREDWRQGSKVHANYKLTFSDKNEDIYRFYTIDETYHLNKGVLAFDEMQDLAGHWQGMPISFRNKIAHHRHQMLDVYSTTQDFNDLHVELRRNVHVRYRCESLLRFPNKDSVLPILQILRVTKKTRQIKQDNDDIRFMKFGRSKLYFISRYWTKKYYNTHANIDFNRFICKVEYEKKPQQKKGKWIVKIYSRDLVSRGKARI